LKSTCSLRNLSRNRKPSERKTFNESHDISGFGRKQSTASPLRE
jgi:hypothetical protein